MAGSRRSFLLQNSAKVEGKNKLKYSIFHPPSRGAPLKHIFLVSFWHYDESYELANLKYGFGLARIETLIRYRPYSNPNIISGLDLNKYYCAEVLKSNSDFEICIFVKQNLFIILKHCYCRESLKLYTDIIFLNCQTRILICFLIIIAKITESESQTHLILWKFELKYPFFL